MVKDNFRKNILSSKFNKCSLRSSFILISLQTSDNSVVD